VQFERRTVASARIAERATSDPTARKAGNAAGAKGRRAKEQSAESDFATKPNNRSPGDPEPQGSRPLGRRKGKRDRPEAVEPRRGLSGGG
jgi:hypothetical protein